MGSGCLDGCFGWLGSRCIGLTVNEPVEWCKFYKHSDDAEEQRLASLESAGEDAARYERGNKKYWLMDITDEFLKANMSAIKRIADCRSLARRIRAGDADAASLARDLLKGRST